MGRGGVARFHQWGAGVCNTARAFNLGRTHTHSSISKLYDTTVPVLPPGASPTCVLQNFLAETGDPPGACIGAPIRPPCPVAKRSLT